MAFKFATAVHMRIVELRRVGGSFEEGLKSFNWSGPEHSSCQGDLELHLAGKVTRKEIPGGNRVVHQKLAATWQPFDLTGEWDDKWGGSNFAWTMYNELAVFAATIPFIRFTLDEHQITGLLTDLKVRYRVRSKIYWTITISPEENETFGLSAETLGHEEVIRKPIAEWAKEFNARVAAISAMRQAATHIPFKTPALSTFDTVLTEYNSALDRLNSVASRGLETDTERRLRLLASTFRRTRGAALNAAIGIRQNRSDVDMAYNDVIGTARYDEWIHTTHTEFMKSIGLSRAAEKDMTARLGRRPRAIHRCMRGESLERISRRYYGTADNTNKISEANNLTSWIFDGGEELIIPSVSAL